MQAGLAGLDQSAATGPMPGVADFFKGIIPDNVISAAAEGDVLPLVVFAMLFALALDAHRGRAAARIDRLVRGDRRRLADHHRLGAVGRSARRASRCLQRRGERGWRGLRRARPLHRPDLGHRHPGDAVGLSDRGDLGAIRVRRVQQGDDRAAERRHFDPLVARFASGDARRGARDRRSRAGRGRDLAALRRSVPGDRAGDEHRRRFLCRALARLRADA